MPTQLWIFTNRQDGSRICFNGETAEARAFLDTLKNRVLGDWCLQGEIEPTMINAAPLRMKSPPPPPQIEQIEEVQEDLAEKLQFAPAAEQEHVAELPRTQVLPVSAQVPAPPPIAQLSIAPSGHAVAHSGATLVMRAPSLAPSPPPAPPQALAAAEVEGNPPPSLLATAKANGKRRHVRYTVPFRVILTSGVKSFRSVCQDISVGGMRLKHKIPTEMFGKPCKIFIGSPFGAESLELDCKIVADPNSANRLSFVDCPPSIQKQLESWILNVEKSQKRAA